MSKFCLCTLISSIILLASVHIVKAEQSINLNWGVLNTTTSDTNFTINEGIAKDSNDNVYVIGVCKGTVDFNPTDAVDSIYCSDSKSSTNSSVYISKYSADGSYLWTRVLLGTVAAMSASDLTVDSAGNVLVGGSFSGTVDLDGTAGTDSHTVYTTNYSTAFLVKYYANGSYAWGRTWGGTSCTLNVGSILVDSNDNVFTDGYGAYGCSFDIDGTSGTTTITNPYSYERLYLSKYSSTGAFLFGKGWGGSSNNSIKSMKLDSSGNVYLSGRWAGNNVDFNFDSGTDSKTSSGYDYFLMKVSNAGAYLWSKNAADGAEQMQVDASGNVIISGLFEQGGTQDFDPSSGTDNLTNSSGSNWAFYSKFASNGAYLWTRYNKLSSLSNSRSAVDSQGNFYFYGIYNSTIDFSTNHSTTDIHVTNGLDDVYLLKINSDGTYGWTKTFGGTAAESIGNVITNSANEVCILGRFVSANMDINPDPNVTNAITPLGQYDIYIIKLDSSGNFVAGGTHGGTSYDSVTSGYPHVIFSEGSDSIVYTGQTNSPVFDMDPSAKEDNRTLASTANSTQFINKISFVTGNVVEAVPSNLKVVLSDDWSTDLSSQPVLDNQTVGVVSTEGKKIASFNLNFSDSSINLEQLTADSSQNKAFMHYPGGFANIPDAASASFTLYVLKGAGNQVQICPGAQSLDDITISCNGGYTLSAGQTVNGATASISEDGLYWVISGLTGTGGMSIISGLHDNLSRLAAGVVSNHTITFGTNYGLPAGSGDTMVVTFKDFDISSIAISDITLTDNANSVKNLAAVADSNNWGISLNTSEHKITFTVPTGSDGGFDLATPIVIKIGTNATAGVNQVINPAKAGTYAIDILVNNAQGESGSVSIPIVDSDQVNITGFVNTFINFDIDTGTTDTDCAYNTCLTHSGGTSASNYVVDLGELNSTWVNKSEDASIMHSDGNNGTINSIYFDLTTNAYNGAILYVRSSNGGLQGPGTNLIQSVTDGNNIQANDGLYGFQLTDTGSGNGTIVRNSNCTTATTYCGLGTSQKEVFTTNSKPLDNGRIRMDLAAASSYVNNPGSYTDTLTFIVSATY